MATETAGAPFQCTSARNHHSLANETHPFVDPDFSHIVQLDAQSLCAVEESLRLFKSSQDKNGEDVNRSNFALPPALAGRLDQAARDIHDEKKGFCIIRGVDTSSRSVEDSVLLFLAVAAYFGDVRGLQSRKGDALRHITRWSTWDSIPDEQRHGIHTSTSLPFHNDMGAEILCLHVRKMALRGGSLFVAEARAVYQQLSTAYPGVAETLMKPDWPIQVSANPIRVIRAPLLAIHDGKVLISMDPGRLGLHPVSARAQVARGGERTELSPAQSAALETLAAVANNQRVQIDIREGDMVFLNNWSLLHARDSYIDSRDAEARRHLVRLWLRNSALGWKIPPAMRVPWEAAYGPHGQGHLDKSGEETEFWKPRVSWSYPPEPTKAFKPTRYTQGSAAFLLDESDGEDKECAREGGR